MKDIWKISKQLTQFHLGLNFYFAQGCSTCKTSAMGRPQKRSTLWPSGWICVCLRYLKCVHKRNQWKFMKSFFGCYGLEWEKHFQSPPPPPLLRWWLCCRALGELHIERISTLAMTFQRVELLNSCCWGGGRDCLRNETLLWAQTFEEANLRMFDFWGGKF